MKGLLTKCQSLLNPICLILLILFLRMDRHVQPVQMLFSTAVLFAPVGNAVRPQPVFLGVQTSSERPVESQHLVLLVLILVYHHQY